MRRFWLPTPVLVGLLPAPVFALMYWHASGVLGYLASEDGVFEYAQAGAYLLGAVALLITAARHRRDLWAWGLGLGMFFVAGEEISWGQRIFGVDTPESLRDANVQGELNLHNIGPINGNVRALGFMLVLGLFVLLPLAQARLRPMQAISRRFRLPQVPRWVVPLALTALLFMLVPRLAGEFDFAIDEVGELYLAITAAAFAISMASAAAADPAPLSSSSEAGLSVPA